MHADPELLALLALGEDAGTDEDRRHAESCPECAGELSELRRVVAVGRSVTTETGLVAPSSHVWARVRDELALEPHLRPPADALVLRPADDPEPLTGAPPLTDVAADRDPELTAHAELTPVEAAWSLASGTAELATDRHGRRLLRVALRADLPSSGVRQAWLVHREDPHLRQSLGVLDGPHGLWTVAHSIDLATYAILDISQQDIGEPGHVGPTIVRGQLTLVS